MISISEKSWVVVELFCFLLHCLEVRFRDYLTQTVLFLYRILMLTFNCFLGTNSFYLQLELNMSTTGTLSSSGAIFLCLHSQSLLLLCIQEN